MVAPIVQASLQAAVLAATSNILAQTLRTYRDHVPLHLNLSAVFQFALFALLNTPPNFLWQKFLESTFPGEPIPTVRQKKYLSEPTSQHQTDTPVNSVVPQQTSEKHTLTTQRHSGSSIESGLRINSLQEPKDTFAWLFMRNTMIKFVLDQTLGAVVNTVAFIGVMGALQGLSNDHIMAKIMNETLPLMVAGYKLWPLVSLLSFTVIPPNRRLLFGNLVGVAWGVFLSLLAGP